MCNRKKCTLYKPQKRAKNNYKGKPPSNPIKPSRFDIYLHLAYYFIRKIDSLPCQLLSHVHTTTMRFWQLVKWFTMALFLLRTLQLIIQQKFSMLTYIYSKVHWCLSLHQSTNERIIERTERGRFEFYDLSYFSCASALNSQVAHTQCDKSRWCRLFPKQTFFFFFVRRRGTTPRIKVILL